MTIKISVPPPGRGARPWSAVSYASHPAGTYVKWQTDIAGLAVGYEVAAITGFERAIDRVLPDPWSGDYER